MKTSTIINRRLWTLSLLVACAVLSMHAFSHQTSARFEPNTAARITTNPAPTATPPPINKTSAKLRKVQVKEPLPEKVDNETARSPVYQINSKYCANYDQEASEGDDFVRHCKAYGDYFLRASGFAYHVNYGIASTNSKSAFNVMLFPLENDAAAKYVRADLYEQKLGDYLEWRLDDKGKPYAVIVHAFFYKNTGSAKTFLNPKNKIAEFVLVRGLAGYEDLKTDLPTANTPFNPDEQARLIAYKYLEKIKI